MGRKNKVKEIDAQVNSRKVTILEDRFRMA